MAQRKTSPKTEALFHPVRMRIVITLAGRQLTPLQLATLLPEVPQATLYRHLRVLVDAGILRVVSERQVRGTVEHVYALVDQAAMLTAEDIAGASREELLRYFTLFVTGLIGDFARYLDREHIDPLADGVGFHQLVFYLDDQEFRQMVVDLNAALRPYLERVPSPDRTRRLFSTIVQPDARPAADLHSEPADTPAHHDEGNTP